MKIVFLTTQTEHHTWYLGELKKYYDNVICIAENRKFAPTFNVLHPFEKEQLEYERSCFFSNREVLLGDICETIDVDDINENAVVQTLESISPDLLITFGTGKIKEPIVSKFFGRIINLHGGDPEFYRGLDSHLWSIYHDDWLHITTTLHMLNRELDDGEIIQKKSLEISKLSSISQLRSLNTRACLELTVAALRSYESLGFFITSQQKTKGRYYSFMPSCLKEVCVNKFHQHVNSK